MRKVVLGCAAVIAVAGLVLAGVLLLRQPAGRSAAGATPTAPATSPTPRPSLPPLNSGAPADRGLLKILAAHPRTPTRPVVSLPSCPLGNIERLAAAGLRAARQTGPAPAGPADITDWRGTRDYGGAVVCSALGASAFTVFAESHVRYVPRAPSEGFRGPIGFDGGRLYQSNDQAAGCGAYWTPSTSTYVVSIQFRPKRPVSPTVCGNALRAVQKPVVAGLARLAA